MAMILRGELRDWRETSFKVYEGRLFNDTMHTKDGTMVMLSAEEVTKHFDGIWILANGQYYWAWNTFKKEYSL